MAHNRDTWWSIGRDEPVEVNQRALIDKVLARYSGEFTVFRELLQNSDDAQSSTVEIHFETNIWKGSEHGTIDPLPLPDLNSTSVAQWTFRNNGIVFKDEDWTRLRKIAEGNPDEKKIGAFGVGFYSLFSVTESPFVSSGGHAMQFYWKDNKDQLRVRRGDLPTNGIADPWTTFEMKLRQAAPIPPLLDLLRFLASSITFMAHLNNVSVYFDEHRIGYIKKSPEMAKDVDIPSTLKRSSGSKIMNVKSVNSRPIKIEAEFLHAPDAAGAVQLTLTLFTVKVDVKVDEILSAELLRSTKKRPPAQVNYHLIYTGKDQYGQSLADSENQPTADRGIFRGLHADLDGATHTRIFIGHSTGQTTGIGGHMASYFIPTVERECLDFIDRNTAIWNRELLYVGGFLSRVVYDSELSAIDNAWTSAANGNPGLHPHRDLQADFLHILKFFAFHRSTPSPEVGQLLRASFYECSSAPIRMLSSIGVRQVSSIKKYDPVLAQFLKDVPMLPSIVSECNATIPILRNRETVSPVTFLDVVHNLRQNPLTTEKLVSCLRWWIKFQSNVPYSSRAQLLDVIVFTNVDGSSIPLSSVQYFIGHQTFRDDFPQDYPLPTSVLPRDVALQFKPEELGSFGWREFPVVNWLLHISNPDVMSSNPAHDFTRSISWTTHVLSKLSRVWEGISVEDRLLVKEALTNKICIPTHSGLRTPQNSYFPGTSTDLFRELELPTVQFSGVFENTKDLEELLLFIGVRKHVDPQLILDRMAETCIWNTPGLIKYLVQVRKYLSEDEVIRLRSSAIFTKEYSPSDANRCCASDLYVPIEVLRRLQLPLIAWDENSIWSNDSDEAGLLFDLGLCRFPPLEKIMDLCSSEDAEVRTAAFQYLCDNLSSKYPDYQSRNFANVAFVPAENNGIYRLEKLENVFSGVQWKEFGFSVIQGNYPKGPTILLGIQQHPPPSMLLLCLEKTPPPDEATARKWFEILFEQISTFSSDELASLSKSRIVPTISSGVRTWLAPTQCYLSDGKRHDFHSKLFVFVDFGSAANRFLSACGSQNEPSVAEIAESLVENPKRFYAYAGGRENFLSQLRNLAVNRYRIPAMTFDKMRLGPILLGKKADSIRGSNFYAHELRSSKEIVIADDVNAHRLFHDIVFIAPEEELLEDFYLSLGCKRLSTVVRERCIVFDEKEDTETSLHVRSLVLERLTLFLYEYPNAKPNVTTDWLSDAENFKVKICKKLSISKILTIGADKTTRSQEASAGANKLDRGKIELWLSESYDEPDMYEISISLCRLLFGNVKASEALLLTAILSTDLEALHRRGCNVDLILNQRQREHDDHDDGENPGKTDDELSMSSMDSTPVPRSCVTEPDIPKLLNSSNAHLPTQSCIITEPEGSKLSSALMDHSLRAVEGSFSRVNLPKDLGPSTSTVQQPPVQNRFSSLIRKLFSRPRSPRTTGTTVQSVPIVTQQHVVPLDDILADVAVPIKARDPEERNMGTIKEELTQHVSGKPKDLIFVGEVAMAQGSLLHAGKSGGVKVFVDADIPDLDTFIVSRKGSLDRFVNTIMPVVNAYRLSMAFLNIFYDTAGGPIVFNRNGSLYINLRHFEAWHDKDVERGIQRPAQISWFFMLAHEIAQNPIKSHNSDPALWFSSICEANMPNLLQLLGPEA